MLDQRLRRWPTLNQHLARVLCWLGKLLRSICWRSTVSRPPTVTQAFVSQHKAHMRKMVNYFLIDVPQVYRVYMTCELAINVAMGMKRI